MVVESARAKALLLEVLWVNEMDKWKVSNLERSKVVAKGCEYLVTCSDSH